MTKLFISYSSKDKLFALDLDDALTQSGYETWIFARDGKHIKDGDYAHALDHAMAGCDIMVYLVTPRTASSPNRRIEMKRFLDAGKPIIPLVLEPTALPDELDRENAVHHMENFYETAEQISEQVIRLSAAKSGSADMPLIFISYPRSETQFAKKIDNTLRANGYRTWIYARDHDPNIDRVAEVAKVTQVADMQLVVVTKQAITKSIGLQYEYEQMTALDKPVIPLLLYPVADLPYELRQVPPVDFQNDFDVVFDDLLATITKNRKLPDAPPKLRVQVCYPSEETPFVMVEIKPKLEEWGYDTWIYTDREQRGPIEREDVMKAVEDSDVMVVVIVPRVRSSLRMSIEYTHALKHGKPVIPLMLRETDLPKELKAISPIDFTSNWEQAFKKLSAVLQQVNEPGFAAWYHERLRELDLIEESLFGTPADAPGEVIPLNDGLTHHIFLSYKRMDGEIMRRVRDDLTKAGFIVWTDELIEKGTPQWQREIEKAIRNTAALLCLLSPEAAQSDYVREELAAAKLFKKPVYLALVRGTREECFIYGFVNSQSTDLRDEDVYARELPLLVEAMRKRIL